MLWSWICFELLVLLVWKKPEERINLNCVKYKEIELASNNKGFLEVREMRFQQSGKVGA
jgi:hypothetical protein